MNSPCRPGRLAAPWRPSGHQRQLQPQDCTEREVILEWGSPNPLSVQTPALFGFAAPQDLYGAPDRVPHALSVQLSILRSPIVFSPHNRRRPPSIRALSVQFLLLACCTLSASSAPVVPLPGRFHSVRSARRFLGQTGSCSWQPDKDKYLVATCLTGKMNHQLECVKKAFHLASLLRRTLLVPNEGATVNRQQQGSGWAWATVVDWKRQRTCLAPACGDNTVLTMNEYKAATEVSKVTVEHIYCAVGGRITSCYDPEGAKALMEANQGEIELPAPASDTVTVSPFDVGTTPTDEALKRYYGGIKDRFLCVGDTFGLRFEKEWEGPPVSALPVLQEDGRDDHCTNIWRPAAAVVLFVNGVLDTLLGSHYAAVHLKTGARSDAGTAVTVEGAAMGVRRLLNGTRAFVMFVASDYRKAELEKFEALLKDASLGKHFSAILSMHAILEDEDWMLHQFWSKEAVESEQKRRNGVVYGLVDVHVCAKAEYFLGAPNSEFTKQVLDVRRAEGRVNPDGVPDLW